uniref:Leucine rich repeat containing protein n=2 Tax=Clytia hemisphaerica TaxID=252671 RepID=A0A7M5XET4_9CNID|eukprot:TCONS_00072469-protein
MLNLYLNEISFIGKGIGKLKQLQSLNLSSNKVNYLPIELFGCESLINLHLDSNKLNYIPQQITKLKELKELSICCNNLPFLNLNIGSMKNLKSVAFFQNKKLWYIDLNSILPKCGHYTTRLQKTLTFEEQSEALGKIRRYYNLHLTANNNIKVPVPPLLEIVLRQMRKDFLYSKDMEKKIPKDIFTNLDCPPGFCCYCEQPVFTWAIFSTRGGYLNIFCSVMCLETFYNRW